MFIIFSRILTDSHVHFQIAFYSEQYVSRLIDFHRLNALSYIILLFGQVGADDSAVLDQIIDSLTSLANTRENNRVQSNGINRISLRVGKVQETSSQKGSDKEGTSYVLIIGAGRVCRPAAEFLASFGSTSRQLQKTCLETEFEWENSIQVIVASLYLKEAEEV